MTRRLTVRLTVRAEQPSRQMPAAARLFLDKGYDSYHNLSDYLGLCGGGGGHA